MPSMTNSALILPLVLWDNKPPDCHISSMIINDSEKIIFTGTTSGHIIMWDFNVDMITPIGLMIGHTSVVNCLAKAGSTKDEEYLVSSSENGEMKLWEVNEKKCVENIKMSNAVHKNIYSSKVNGKYTRLFCIGNYTDVLVMDPMSLDILYTLVSREHHQWINALCINTLANKQDEVIVGVSLSGTIKLWTVNANEQKGSEIVEHEFKNCLCENAYTLTSCPGKQRIFIVVCPKFFQVFDAFDFTVLCQVRINSLPSEDQNENVSFINGFFLDIDHIIVCANNGFAYLYMLPDNVNPLSASFRNKAGRKDSEKFVTTRLVCKFAAEESLVNGENSTKLNGAPIFTLYELKKNNMDKTGTQTQQSFKYLVRGDWNGTISIWNLNEKIAPNSCLMKQSDYDMSLAKFWKENVKQDNENFGCISTFLYLPTIDKIVYGITDGSIIILPAIDFLMKRLFKRNWKQNSNYIKLKKHNAKITCILYPNAESKRYDPTYLVTGSADFSVILWNINTGEMIHRFIVQAGEILQLSVPPNNVNPRILQCICSIASDHSVALLSLKECKPVMVASNHLFPILFIKWRPLDDFLIVKCSDGGVFVWQIETGSLDRIAHGITAEEILTAADEVAGINQQIYTETNPITNPANVYIPSPSTTTNAATTTTISATHVQSASNSLSSITLSTPMIVSSKSISNQTISLAHMLHKRNISNTTKTINSKITANSIHNQDTKKNQTIIDSSSINFPLLMQTFHLNSKDPVNHLILFDVDSLLTTLILEEQAIDSMIKYIKTNFFKDTHNVQTATTQVIAPLYRTTPDYSTTALKRAASSKLCDSIDIKQLNALKLQVNYAQSIIKLTNILLSSLHVWSIDENLDKLFMEKLFIQKPKYPILFGRISRVSHIFIMFPAKRVQFELDPENLKNQETLETRQPLKEKCIFNLDDDRNDDQFNKVLVTNSNHFYPKNKNCLSFELHQTQNNALDSPSPTKNYWQAGKTMATEHLLAILAISNSFMSLHNFIDLQIKNENLDPIEFILGEKALQNEEKNYSESQSTIRQTYSRLSTMYCMLADYYPNDLPNASFKSVNLETLALKWMDPSYEIREATQALLKSELKRLGPTGRANLIKIWEPQLSSLLKEFDDLNQLSVQQQQQQTQYMQQISQVSNSLTTSVPVQNEQNSTDSQIQSQSESDSISNQTNSNRIRSKQFVAIIILSLIGAEFGQDVNSNKNQGPYKTIPQGFSLEDHSILKRISTALSNLVTNKSFQFDLTRRAAIDLIGRGFTVWEPFIQPTFVLLSLLELSADAELYVPRLSFNLPLSPVADTCRISRNSLSIIANSKPKTFILAIAKEIKRINASSIQSLQTINSNYPFSTALTRGKPEILKIIERLIDNQSQDVYELLSDVIEIVLFCLDMNQVRSISVDELFSPLFKFPMVRYCKETKRIASGCHNGRLVIYEYKNSKWHFQSYPAHNNQPIAAVAISSDSKQIASYSAHDNSLIFWQSSGGTIFNIGSNTLKQLKVCNAAPIQITVPCNKLASLSWQNKTLNLVYHDGRKFSYQV